MIGFMEVKDFEREMMDFAFGCYFKDGVPHADVKRLWSNAVSYVKAEGDKYLIPKVSFDRMKESDHKDLVLRSFVPGEIEYSPGRVVSFDDGVLHPQTFQNIYGMAAEVDLLVSSRRGNFIDAAEHMRNALGSLGMKIGRDDVIYVRG